MPLRRSLVVLSALLASLTVASGLALAQDAAPAPLTPPPAQKPERPDLYDEKADATEQIAAALHRAKLDNKRVLVQWGAERCGWCHLLHEKLKGDPELRRKIQYEYEVVHVDIGQWDKHLDVAQRYGADFKKHGVPYLTVLDADGNVLANQETGSLEAKGEKPSHDSAKVMAFLTEHQAPYPKAESVLADGLAEAARTNRRVFLHFGAPWCVWCHRLEAWMRSDEVAPLLARDFVDVKIDVDRTEGGPALRDRFTDGASTGIPVFFILNADGSVAASSIVPGTGNLGCPYTDEEVEAFRQLLLKVSPNLGQDGVERAIDLLKAQHEAAKAGRSDGH